MQPPLAASLWFRDAASTGAASSDWLFYAILWISIFFFVLIIGLMVVFMARYYARPGYVPKTSSDHSNTLEVTWSIIPIIIVAWIFVAGAIGYIDMRTPPDNAYEIQVIAKKWNWSFVYPNGYIDSDLHVPIDQPVKLTMSSEDVLHSLFIPAFRTKMDCVPGRYSFVWFEATQVATPDDGDDVNMADEGGFDLFCAEYCGQGHSSMKAKVIVHESGTFKPWLEKAMVWDESESPVARGEQIYKKRGCAQCHSTDGSALVGPSFMGTFGTEQGTDKGVVTVDDNYIRESVLNPMAKIRDGFKGIMPSFQGQLKENEIAALIWFHKSLNGKDVPETWSEIGGVPGQEAQKEETETEDAAGEAVEETTTEEVAVEAADGNEG